jgi:hypothetical protein
MTRNLRDCVSGEEDRALMRHVVVRFNSRQCHSGVEFNPEDPIGFRGFVVGDGGVDRVYGNEMKWYCLYQKSPDAVSEPPVLCQIGTHKRGIDREPLILTSPLAVTMPSKTYT